MATRSKKQKTTNVQEIGNLLKSKMYHNLSWKKLWELLLDPRQFIVVAALLFIAEIIVNILVIKHVKYTEIDWIAYMQEVEGVVNGTYDYANLKGDTGPLVYPAGFVYIFGIMYYITEYGSNVRLAQYVFGVFYLSLLLLVFSIYNKTKKVPPYVILLACCTSYRIHSIFVLRMFNDAVAVLLLYLALNMFLNNYWNLGSTTFSIAVSVKMNILLYAPALLLSYYHLLGFHQTIFQLGICAVVQLILGLPFLLSNPISYIMGSFDLGRIFFHKWTVNWRFLPEDIFVNRYFHITLLALHLLVICLFLPSWNTYFKSFATLKRLEKDIKPQLKKRREKVTMDSTSQLFILPLFTCNFIGVAFSRSLHYQFYVWYFHSLPYLLWSTPYAVTWRLIIMGVIELCWNTYPSTVISSAALHVCHIALLYGLYKGKYNKS